LAAGYAADSSLAICGMLGGLLDDIMMCLWRRNRLHAAAEGRAGYSCVSQLGYLLATQHADVVLLLDSHHGPVDLRRPPLPLAPGIASRNATPAASEESSGSL
jgi:hypothetical protein